MSDAELIVIGSGPAGVSAALPLVEAGRNVLMLDGGADDAWDMAGRSERILGDELEGLSVEDGLSPKLRAPLARRALANFAAANPVSADNFLPVGALLRGGLSRVWGAFVSEFDADDLAGWPIGKADLAPSYEHVVRRIGVSGAADDATGSWLGASGPLQPPVALGAAAQAMLGRYRSGGSLLLGKARNALLSQKLEERAACDLRGDCLWGCPIGAIYDARQNLVRLSRYRNFRLTDNVRVTALEKTPQGWRVRVADGRDFTAARLVLAAGTLGSTRLTAPLLPAISDWPLLSNPVRATPLLVPRSLGVKSQASHDLAQLAFFLRFRSGPAGYVSGAVYETRGLPPSVFANQLPLGRRAGEAAFRFLAPGLVVAVSYFAGAFSRNRLKFDPVTGHLHVTGGFADRFAALEQDVNRRLRKSWRRVGAIALPGGKIAMPGTDAHFAGTLPMGGRGANGTSPLGELAGQEGLHVVDGAILPSLPSKHATLTIMANADRIGRALSQFEQRDRS